jgi:hypothetical protein
MGRMRTLVEIVPLRTAACRDAVDAVAMIAAGEAGVDRRAGAHVSTCLRCQAEVAAYRRVLATMRAMRGDRLAPPIGALDDALTFVRDGGAAGEGTPAWALRAAYVGGLTAASAAGVLVWFSRRRLGLPNAS